MGQPLDAPKADPNKSEVYYLSDFVMEEQNTHHKGGNNAGD